MGLKCNKADGCPPGYKEECPHAYGHEEEDNCTHGIECKVIDKDVKCVPVEENKKVYCRDCRFVEVLNNYCAECWHPDNIEKRTKDTWLQEIVISVEHFRNPSDMNSNNDCAWHSC